MALTCPYCGLESPDSDAKQCARCQTNLHGRQAAQPVKSKVTVIAVIAGLFFLGGVASQMLSSSRSTTCNSGRACRELGINYENTSPKDLALATQFYEQACQQNDTVGCRYAADMYNDGKGVAAEPKQATALYTRACELEDWRACQFACTRFKKGIGAGIDMQRALSLCQRSCEHNDSHGCNDLALFYRDGIRVDVDNAKANTLFANACKDGDGLACHNLAGMLKESDPARAAALEKEACDKKEQQGCEALSSQGQPP